MNCIFNSWIYFVANDNQAIQYPVHISVIGSKQSFILKSILILDDNIDVLESLEALLSGSGYQVFINHTVSGMLATLGSITPDLFLLDVVVGNDNGSSVCAYLKSVPHYQHIPVLLMSGIVNFHIKSASEPVFADDYIDKPYSNELVLEKVAELLRLEE
ncbi:MAG: response regulator [Pedobacter sp.]|nr:MAG: response regulator [Pedobacter sp.]